MLVADPESLDAARFFGEMASRLYWEATGSGPHYVAVSGYGTGAYTLTIDQR